MLKPFSPLHIKPRGWLRRQLEIQADGLSGHVDKIWPDIRDSAWTGGDRDGWERLPYWLDGFLPLAYLLEDEDKIRRASACVRAILDRQRPDGWICPCADDRRGEYDLWSYFLIGKVLAMYAEFTGDRRAERGLYDAMKCLYGLLADGRLRLSEWGKFRWFEGLIPLLYLDRRCHEDWIPALGRELRRQGVDYPSLEEEWKRPLNHWRKETHVVNIAMMLKYEALCSALFGEKNTGMADRLWRTLEKYNGTAFGAFTGDECLSGLGGNHGTELCSVVELMYSCELLYALTEKPVWADRLEKLAFNALPAALSDDMWTHQYDQMANQIACMRFPGKPFFRTNSNESNLFGLEPNFGCCTANFNQGWPKFALHAFYRSPRGIVCAVMLPAELTTEIGGAQVRLLTETEYPFRLSCRYTVSVDRPVRFELKIRLPKWAKAVRLNGEEASSGPFLTIRQEWSGTESLTLELQDCPRLVSRPFGLKSAEYGALVFALPISAEYKKLEYERDGVERRFPYCDYELLPRSEWRCGFASGELTAVGHEGDDFPFSSKNPRLSLKASLCRVNWEYADGYEYIAANTPASRKAAGPPEEWELIPYGCAKLRLTELPLVRQK